jgi:hypothetical protein
MIPVEDLKALVEILKECGPNYERDPDWHRYYHHRDRIFVGILEEIGDCTNLLECLEYMGELVRRVGRVS